MAKGSQLSQLKAALSEAGVTRQPQNGKKRKRTVLSDQDKAKRAAKIQEIHQRLNPFDVKVTKLKHDVGGRKLKGVVGRPAQSKQVGIEQRKKTLLKEFEEKERAGGIIDRRFGEDDPSMSLEDRMLERFTKERQRASKGAVFNLEDEDELTHYGQSLSKLDDFDNIGLMLDEEEDGGQIDQEIVKRTHFGGFEDDEDAEEDQSQRKKSKAEVMTEVIAKSKEHKMLRQIEKEREENIRHELDQEFDSLKSLIYAPDASLTGSNSIPLGDLRHPRTEDGAHFDYDQNVRELAFEKRAKPKDRTKTEEELALEAKEALEKAERKRKKRMMGEEDDSEDEPAKKKGKVSRGGDDLDDDFAEEGWDELGAGLVESKSVPVSSSEESSEDGSSDGEGGREEAEASGSEDESKGDNSEAEAGPHEHLVAKSKARSKNKKSKSRELPFTFPCPETHDEFLEILDGVEDEEVPTVIQRIRALYHPSLSPDNKFKLEGLTSVLIDHILYITSPPSPRFSVLSSLVPHLFALTTAYPRQSAESFVAKLSLMHKNLKRGLAHGPLDPEAKTWPSLSELSFLRIVGVLWSTSDMNHAVISPTRLLIGAYLGLGRIRSLTDLASGLFLCTIFLQFEMLSKRFAPEVINFLINTLLHLVPNRFKNATAVPGSFPLPDFRSGLCRKLAINSEGGVKVKIRNPNLLNLLSEHSSGDQEKADLLGVTLSLLAKFSDLYKGLEGFPEAFGPILTVLDNLELKHLHETHQATARSLRETLERLLKFSIQSRRPLTLQAHKPIPIPTYVPKFETTSSNYLRRQDPDHEKNEASKLRNQYKQERKGAIRELRKDARFLAGVEQKKQFDKDRSYNERMKRVFGSIEGERAEQKQMEREKIKEKKRAGRR